MKGRCRVAWGDEDRARADRAGEDFERGSSALEVVIVLPVLMALVAFGMQLAIWSLAAHVIDDAVSQAGAALRDFGGTVQAAGRAVVGEVEAIGGGFMLDPRTSVEQPSGGELALTARAGVPDVLVPLRLVVSATSVGPAQVFRASG
jgi:Flp pilus assembly protein TadG